MRYLVSRYSRTSDELLTEFDVSGIGPEDLAGVFGQAAEAFVESYPIGPKEAAQLHALAGIDLDLSDGDYFLEVFAADDPVGRPRLDPWPTADTCQRGRQVS